MPSRRAVLAAVAGVTAGGRAATAGSALPATQSTGFHDDFADGEWRDRWSVVAEAGTADVRLVDPPGPSTSALELTQASGGGAATRVGWSEPRAGWDRAWQLSGRFYVDSFTEGRPWQGHNVRLSADPADGEADLQLRFGFRDGDNEPWLFGLDGTAMAERVGREVDWQRDTWYEYRLRYDGDGRYDACLWSAGDAVASVAVENGPRPGDEERVAVIDVNGADRTRVTVAHDVVDWRPAGATSGGSTESTATVGGPCTGGRVVEQATASDSGATRTAVDDSRDAAATRPDDDQSATAWLDSWAPLVAALAGVPVVGPLVLGALVALEGRFGGDEDTDDPDGR